MIAAAMRFEKWQALGNDYLIVEAGELPWELTPARVRKLCDPHRGVGSDGILLLSPSEDPGYVASLRIFNPDGSEAELSGNGSREAVMYLRRHGRVDSDEFAILTAAGPMRPRITGPSSATIAIGRRLDGLGRLSLRRPGRARRARRRRPRAGRFQHVSIGNPQCAIACEELETLDLARDRPRDRAPRALPQPHQRLVVPRARAGRDPRPDLRARRRRDALLGDRRERRRGRPPPRRRPGARSLVRLDGGELTSRSASDLQVTLTGWAVPVFAGALADDFRKELDETQ